MISEHPITARKGSPDLMEHIAGVIEGELRRHEQLHPELAARRYFNLFVKSLLDAAMDTAQEGPRGAGRAVFWGRAVVLDDGINKLLKVILDHPSADVRAERLTVLHDVLDAAATIGGCLNTPITAVDRLRRGPAELAKLEYRQQQDEILVKVARTLRQKHSEWKRWQIAGEKNETAGRVEFNDALKAQDFKSLGHSQIDRLLKPLWPRIVSPSED
jgi:hypothetical protein